MQKHSLMPLVTSRRRLQNAARQCMRRASSRGPDGVSWRDYRNALSLNLDRLSSELLSGEWNPSPCRTVNYEFFTGKLLTIVIPTVEDRIVHRAIRNVLTPPLTQILEPWVYGYLPGYSRVSALRAAAKHASSRHVANIDVANVSGNMSVSSARDLFALCTSDGSLLTLIEQILESLPSAMAIGSGLSPMLIHLRLAAVDREIAHLKTVRFADNYVIFCETAPEATEAFDKLCSALAKSGLAPAPTKSWTRFGLNPEDLFLLEV